MTSSRAPWPVGRPHSPSAWLSALLALLACTSCGEGRSERGLDSFILEHMERHNVPGLAAAVVDSGRIVWTGVYGVADFETDETVTADTPFQIASASKPITATVLLSTLITQDVGLDQDVGELLPFPVRNPGHPDVAITPRQLLRHRSSITDNSDYYQPFWSVADGDPTVPLGEYLRDYLVPGGSAYDSAANFLATAPGSARRYCNTCYALLGYLAEHLSDRPFERLSAELLFSPLGMDNTAWFLRDLGASPAMPYRHAGDSGYVAYGHNGYPDWPAGQLRTSVTDLARFLAAYTSGGERDGRSVIDPRVIDTLTPRSADVGFHTWSQLGLRDRVIYYVHEGGDIGVRTVIGFRTIDGRGAVVLTNGEGPVLPVFEEVVLRAPS